MTKRPAIGYYVFQKWTVKVHVSVLNSQQLIAIACRPTAFFSLQNFAMICHLRFSDALVLLYAPVCNYVPYFIPSEIRRTGFAYPTSSFAET